MTRVGRCTETIEVENSWAVSYFPKLTRMFSCHSNMEIWMSRIGSIKYLFKYICKGSDWLKVEMTGENQRYNEISTF